MALPAPEPARLAEPATARTLAVRAWDLVRTLATVIDHVEALEKEDGRIQSQLLELGRITLELSRDVHELLGQMTGIERRLEDKDRLIEATIRLRIMEEIAKLRAEFRPAG
jgi:hypothetical protein